MKNDSQSNKRMIKERIVTRINLLEKVNDETVLELIESFVYQDLLFRPVDEKEEIITYLFNHFRRLGIIQPLLDDDRITEIMINGYKIIFIEKLGTIVQTDIQFENEKELHLLIQKIVGKMDRKVNEKYPICDVRLVCGSRVNIVLNPIAIDGPCVTIRKFPKKKFKKLDIIKNQTVTKEVMDFMELLVQKRYNLFISGGTSSGKTTLLNILSDAISESERVITIEDSAELRLLSVKNLIRLEARTTNDNLTNKIPIKDLIKSSLRMRPDRIIVGEVRGEETIDMLQAMNTGHDGSISTGHSNTLEDMLVRLETMVLSGIDIPLLAIRQQIASAIDVMIHIQKISGKGRRIIDISEVVCIKEQKVHLNPLFLYDSKKDALVKTDNKMMHKDKMLWN